MMRKCEFFRCGMRNSDKGYFAECSALDFLQITLDNFPHSAIRIPQNTRAPNWIMIFSCVSVGL